MATSVMSQLIQNPSEKITVCIRNVQGWKQFLMAAWSLSDYSVSITNVAPTYKYRKDNRLLKAGSQMSNMPQILAKTSTNLMLITWKNFCCTGREIANGCYCYIFLPVFCSPLRTVA